MKTTLGTVLLLVILAPLLNGCPLVVGAGIGAGALMADDRRTSGAQLEDQGIESKAKTRIDEKYGSQVYYNVTSFNRYVLITGQAPTEEIKEDIAILVLEVPNVRNIQNEMVISGNASLTSRASDSLITGRVKGRLSQNKNVGANHVKVVTENGTVFLMGLVTQEEATAAGETAATTSGVQKVVKVFEYLN
jgi:osmotically-inducible protein OsmY